MSAIIPLTNEIMGQRIFLRQLADMRQVSGFRHGRKRRIPFPANALWYNFFNKLVETPDIQLRQHDGRFRRIGANVPASKGLVVHGMRNGKYFLINAKINIFVGAKKPHHMTHFISMRIFSKLLVITFLCSFSFVLAQDTLLFINGKERLADQISRKDGQISYRWLKKKKPVYPVADYVEVKEVGLVSKDRVLAGRLLERTDSKIRFETSTGQVREYAPNEVFDVTETSLIPVNVKVKRGVVRRNNDHYEFFSVRKQKTVREEKLFAIFNQQETLIYRQDTLSRNFFLPENEARAYIYGRRSARRHYESIGTYFAAAAIGGGGVIFNYFYIPLPMVAFTFINAAIPPKVKKTGPEDAPWLNNPDFIEGYRYQASRRKFRNAWITGIPGVLIGAAGRAFYYGVIY